MPATIPPVFYSADIDLKTLELNVRRDEANASGPITSIDVGKDEDGNKVTRATYERVKGKLGRATVVVFTTEVDRQSQKAIHESQGETFVIAGRAFINNKIANVMVFRGKAKPKASASK